MKRIVLWGILISFTFVGAIVTYSGIQDFVTSRRAESWPTVEGEVSSVEIEKQESRLGLERNEPTSVSYHARVKYIFTVDGSRYEGDKITVEDTGSDDRRPAARLAMQYRAGAPVTVYYNPDKPQEAILKPGELGGTWSKLILGLVFMIVPASMVIFIGGAELVPPTVRLWWDLKYGKYCKIDAGDDLSAGPAPSNQATENDSDRLPEIAGSIRETIVQWEPGKRVEMSTKPDPIHVLVLTSLACGFVAAFVGFFPISTMLYGFDAEWPEKAVVFPVVFALVTLAAFGYQRLHDRATQTEIDWQLKTLRTSREFSNSWEGSLADIQAVVVRCAPKSGKRTRYRANVVLDIVGRQLAFAHTTRPMRKAAAAKQQALGLAEPLALELGVPIRMEGWEQE